MRGPIQGGSPFSWRLNYGSAVGLNMRKQVQYNILQPLVCREHHEHGPLMCCPFPGCQNGTDQDEIEATGPRLPRKVYTRFQWTKPGGEACYSWMGGEDRPLGLSIKR